MKKVVIVLSCILISVGSTYAFDGSGFKIQDGFITGDAQIDVIDYSGASTTYITTWTKPAWATMVHIWCVGGGGGGRGGNKGNSLFTTTSTGGASSGPDERTFRASELPATLTVVIGKGSTGGSGATSNDGTGGGPGAAQHSRVGVANCSVNPTVSSQTPCLVFSWGAASGSSSWTGVSGGTPLQSGVQNQTCTGLASNSPGAGGGGGGIATASATSGYAGSDGCRSPGSGGSGGLASGGLTGSNGQSYSSGRRVGGGAGGGAASVTAGVNGGTGGVGGTPGGGGGGGGAGLNDTNNGGTGGAGGNGQCVFISY